MAVQTFKIAASGDDGWFDHWDAADPVSYPPTENIESWSSNEATNTLRAQKWHRASPAHAELQCVFLRWDTSLLPSNATITNVVLKIYPQAINDENSRNLNVEWYIPSAWPPVDASDFAENVGDTAGAFDITSLTSGAVNSLTLSSPTSVNLNGYTYLRIGISGGDPVDGQNRVDFASFDHVSDPEAELVVTYTAPITGKGDVPIRSAWLTSPQPLYKGKIYADFNADDTIAWNDWFFGEPVIISDTRDVRITGELSGTPSDTAYDARIMGENVSSLAQDVRITGQLDSDQTVDVRITGNPAPTTPAYSDSNAQGFSGTSWSFTTAPTGNEGDVMLAWIVADVNTNTVTSAPSGWTHVAGPIDNSGTADVRAWLYRKIAGASEAGPYVWDFSATQGGGITMWRGGPVDTTTPIDDFEVTGTTAGTSHASGTITTTGPNRRIVCFAGGDESATFTPYWSAWTNSATEREDNELNNFTEHGAADYELASAGNTSFTVTSADSDGGVVGIVAINPATDTTSNTTHDVRITGTADSSLAIDARITGQLDSSLATDARITGQADSSLATDARIFGHIETAIAQDARITGALDSSLTADVRINGSVSPEYLIPGATTYPSGSSYPGMYADDERAIDARITGEAVSSDSKDVRTTGEADSSLATDARIFGHIETSVTIDARITGEATSSSDTDVRIQGQEDSSLATDVRITGQLDSSLAIDVRIQGQEDSSLATDARITGQADSSLATDVRITGEATSSVTYDVRITGEATSSLATDVRIQGQADSSLITDVRTTGEAHSYLYEVPYGSGPYGSGPYGGTGGLEVRITGDPFDISESKDVRITGQADSSVAYDIRITGEATSSASTDVRIQGQDDSSLATDVRITGQLDSSLSQDVRLTGSADNSLATDVRIIGEADSSVATDARITGQADSSLATDARITGQLDSNQSVDIRIQGQDDSSLATDVRIVGETPGSFDTSNAVDARINGQADSSLATDVRITGQLDSSLAQDVRITGQQDSSIVTDTKITGEATSTLATDVRLIGGLFTSLATDTRVTGQEVSANAVDSYITGEASVSNASDVRVVGEAVLDDARDIRITGQADSSHQNEVRVSGELGSDLSTDVRIIGEAPSDTVVDVRLTGELDSFVANDVAIIGEAPSELAIDVKIRGLSDNAWEHDVAIIGGEYIDVSIDVSIIGFVRRLRKIRYAGSRDGTHLDGPKPQSGRRGHLYPE